jgi:hypothetical protein
MGGSGRPPQPAKSARRGPRSRLRAMRPSQNRELGRITRDTRSNLSQVM